MLHTRALLERFHEILSSGHQYTLKPGLRIGRGFADIGFEEYSVLTGFSVVSLHTGKAITVEPDYRQFYFPIYSVDELTHLLYESECDLVQVEYHDQREWQVFINTTAGQKKEFEATTLQEALLEAFIWRLKGTACT